MKQAIKVLEKRIELLNKEYDKKDKEFEDCEMVCDIEFLQNDLANIELEIIELKKAIEVLNNWLNTPRITSESIGEYKVEVPSEIGKYKIQHFTGKEPKIEKL
jgi:hypothetical protein